MQDAAVAKGLPGVCALARRVDAKSIVLFRDADLLATHDIHPAARYRVDPADRTSATIRRKVAPKTTYVDLNGSDNLELAKGAEINLDWDAPGRAPRSAAAEMDAGDGTVELVKPDGTVIQAVPGGRSPCWCSRRPAGSPAGSKLVFRAPTTVLRVMGFEPVPGFTSTTRGPTLFRATVVRSAEGPLELIARGTRRVQRGRCALAGGASTHAVEPVARVRCGPGSGPCVDRARRSRSGRTTAWSGTTAPIDGDEHVLDPATGQA